MLVAGYQAWRGADAAAWWLLPAALSGVLAMSWTRPLAPLNRLWMRVGLLLNTVANPLLLGLIYFAAIVPMAILLRLLRKDLLRLRLDPSAATYWIACDEGKRRDGAMKDQF